MDALNLSNFCVELQQHEGFKLGKVILAKFLFWGFSDKRRQKGFLKFFWELGIIFF